MKLPKKANGKDSWRSGWDACLEEVERLNPEQPEYVLYGYATPSGKLYASAMDATMNGEQSYVKVYVNKEDLK